MAEYINESGGDRRGQWLVGAGEFMICYAAGSGVGAMESARAKKILKPLLRQRALRNSTRSFRRRCSALMSSNGDFCASGFFGRIPSTAD